MSKILGNLLRTSVLSTGLLGTAFLPLLSIAQAPATAVASPVRQLGTVKAIEGSTVTLGNDTGKTIAVTVPAGARILQLAPGSTDLKAAQTITLADIAVGDRILITGKPGAADDTVTASRVILMKSTDIAEKRATEQQDWQKNGTSGLVNAIEGAGYTVSSGAKKLTVQTTSATIFRRYADDSVKFQDAKAGTASQIQVGDQLSVRGTRAEDGSSITAAEIVSGSFRNLSGVISAVDTAAGMITLKDLATSKTLKVVLTAKSDLRRLPPEAAERFAARSRGTISDAPGAGGGQGRPAQAAGGSAGTPGAAGPAGAGGDAASRPGGRSAGMDLSQMLTRLPAETIADIKAGDTVMIVASSDPAQQAGTDLTAVTLLNGVAPILSTTPKGQSPVTLSPWNIGGGAPEGGGGS